MWRALAIEAAFVFSLVTSPASADLPSHDCEQYREDVQEWLMQEGASPDYYWLMVAESRCRVGAVSSKGARGFWQMMGATMRHYGCDNAEDLECQTRAAARYLLHLERLVGRAAVVYGWNMGGHNYLKAGRPTREAKGLAHLYKEYAHERVTRGNAL